MTVVRNDADSPSQAPDSDTQAAPRRRAGFGEWMTRIGGWADAFYWLGGGAVLTWWAAGRYPWALILVVGGVLVLALGSFLWYKRDRAEEEETQRKWREQRKGGSGKSGV